MIKRTVLVFSLLASPLLAEDGYVAPRDLGCVAHEDLSTEMIPPELARIVRACINDAQFDNAFRVWLSFSSYALFDQQRVADESAHAVLQDLYSWTFAAYPRGVMDQVKAAANAFRDPEGDAFLGACAQIIETGHPTYHPAYMIVHGMWPRKSEEDWLAADFDPVAAWVRAVSEVNGCPAF